MKRKKIINVSVFKSQFNKVPGDTQEKKTENTKENKKKKKEEKKTV